MKLPAYKNNELLLAEIFGIGIYVDLSWVLIFLLVTGNLALGIFPQMQPNWTFQLTLLMSVATSLLFFMSVLAHELAHALVAQKEGLAVSKITLFVLGGVANIEKEPENAKTEFLMALAGPATSLLLAITFFSIGLSMAGLTLSDYFSLQYFLFTLPNPITTAFLWLGPVNLILGLFNLIPGFPLDGGRVLHALLWEISSNKTAATKTAVLIGKGISWGFVLLGTLMIFGIEFPIVGTGMINGLWMSFIGMFLNNAASKSYEQLKAREALETIPVSKLMQTNIKPVPAGISVGKLINEYILGNNRNVYPVEKNNKVTGLVSFDDISDLPREEWEEVKVDQIMKPVGQSEIFSISDNSSAEPLLKLTKQELSHLPVTKNGHLVGILNQQDLLLWLKLQKKDELIS